MRVAGPITIYGVLAEPSWMAAATVGDFQFPWWKEGDKKQTEARLLWDDENLCISYGIGQCRLAAEEQGSRLPLEYRPEQQEEGCVRRGLTPQ